MAVARVAATVVVLAAARAAVRVVVWARAVEVTAMVAVTATAGADVEDKYSW